MRVAVGSLLQETNTFSPQLTLREHFQLATGTELLAAARREKTEVLGFIDALAAAQIEIVPLLGGWAVSSGRMVRDEFESLLAEFLRELRQAGSVDGVLLALHGAWAAEGDDSADGRVLQEVRNMVGPGTPVVASLDLHANLTSQMCSNADALVGYRTSPHIDLYETGQRAAALLFDMLDGARPAMAMHKLRMVTQAEQHLSDRGVLKELLDFRRSMEKRPGVASVSFFPVQPWLDVEELGWSTLVITDGDRSLAEALADELADQLWSQRFGFATEVPGVVAALERAMAIDGGPVTLGEGADGTMGGSPGDSTWILQGLLDQGLDSVSTAAVVVDPEAVAQAIEAGIGATVTLSVGGTLNPTFATPVKVTGRVKLISDGQFRYKGRCYTGRLVQMGRAVVLEINNIKLLIGERTMPTTDPEMYRSHGIEPRDMKLVLVKSPLALRMEYEPISKAVISVDSPGCCRADLSQLPFERLPRPMFPFDDIADWRVVR